MQLTLSEFDKCKEQEISFENFENQAQKTFGKSESQFCDAENDQKKGENSKIWQELIIEGHRIGVYSDNIEALQTGKKIDDRVINLFLSIVCG